MANADPVAVDCEVDLPDKKVPVTVSLESDGVSFVAFQMDLVMGSNIIKPIHSGGTERDLGTEFPLEDARTLRGLVLVCRGFVGAAVASTIQLQCVFRFDGIEKPSKPAVITLTQTASSAVFRIRCLFV
jgi:hypothetical protein